jgi:hypothetical protein
MLARPSICAPVIYDAAVRRVVSVCLGALASLFVLGLTHAGAQTTTTTPPVPPSTVVVDTTTTTQQATTTTTTRSSATTTTQASGGRPIPPPAAGPTQTLVPDLLGTPLEIATTTTSTSIEPFVPLNRGTLPTNITTPIATTSDSPSGFTLILAAVAWLASFGGLLVYAEEKRSERWKHLAR